MKTPQVCITHIRNEPRHAQSVHDFNELSSALAKVRGRINEIEAVLHVPVDRDSMHLAAALEFASTGKVRGPDNAPDSLSAERAMLLDQEGALKKALEARRSAIDEVTREISLSVCAGLAEAHRKMAGELLQKLREVDALFEQEKTFLREIEDNGYEARFAGSLQWAYVGSLKQQSESALWHKVRELENYGR